MTAPWVKICGVTRPQDAALAAELGATMVGINFWSRSPRFVADHARARAIADAARERGALVVGVFVDQEPSAIEELEVAIGLDRMQLHGDEPDGVVARFAPRAIRAVRAVAQEPPTRDEDQTSLFNTKAKARTERRSAMGEGGGRSGGGSGSAVGVGAADGLPASGGPGGGGAESGGDPSSPPALREASFLNWNVFAFLCEAPSVGARRGGVGESWDWSLATGFVRRVAPVPVLVAGGIRVENLWAALEVSGAFGVDLASGVEASGRAGVKDAEKMKRLFEEVRRGAT